MITVQIFQKCQKCFDGSFMDFSLSITRVYLLSLKQSLYVDSDNSVMLNWGFSPYSPKKIKPFTRNQCQFLIKSISLEQLVNLSRCQLLCHGWISCARDTSRRLVLVLRELHRCVSTNCQNVFYTLCDFWYVAP